jgi:hypothetical protein
LGGLSATTRTAENRIGIGESKAKQRCSEIAPTKGSRRQPKPKGGTIMSLHKFGSDTQRRILFSPQFGGIKAVYFRRIEDKETGETTEYKSVELYISPQGNYVASERRGGRIDARVNVIWAKTADLKFDGVPFLPEEKDVIKYFADGEEQRYAVTALQELRTQSSFGQHSTFAYEDGAHQIIKIMTVRVK